MSLREIIFDTETTGLDPYDGHRLVEIGCVEMVDRVLTGKSFHRYLNPERDVPMEAARVHGLTTERLKREPLFAQVVDEFLAFLGDSTLVAHNADFDMKFLNWELKIHDRAPWPADRVIDTLAMAKKQFPGAKASLDALASRFGVDTSARVLHGALLDAQILAEVYIELTGGKQRGLSLGAVSARAEIVSAKTVTALAPPADRPARPARAFAPSDDECAAHAAFIKGLPNSLWPQQS
jgi:DNA polymerase III subunit epsilon